MTAHYQQVLEGTYDNHVLPFLWMKGESHKTIAEYLEKIAGADIHEVCLESRPHPDFCGEGWWRDLRFVIDECRQLGLKLWILDDAHFPTGFANGAVKEAVPEPQDRAHAPHVRHRGPHVRREHRARQHARQNGALPRRDIYAGRQPRRRRLPSNRRCRRQPQPPGLRCTCGPHAGMRDVHERQDLLQRGLHQYGRPRLGGAAHRCCLRAAF